ncbi:hypothetical protein BZG02_13435 [Labilibaculum filiforme]|uniref:Uncharacterized protein n=1 Tax=Labilibaculum filiforme TaxID=1940526 RepID=A0A2N3HW89_9BACT|nr:hypothetical protein BZG02_13435 [Labilibaculum filiforme]
MLEKLAIGKASEVNKYDFRITIMNSRSISTNTIATFALRKYKFTQQLTDRFIGKVLLFYKCG